MHADRETALWVVRRLREAGFEALFAGGCVRDMELGIAPADYDVATSATPQDVQRLFRRVLLVGAQFGVAVVVRNRRHVEVATFRSDVSYSDGRRPDAVRFSSPREDALRRDFTINGMFYDPIAGRLIDYVGGRADLERGVVRTIGPPEARFGEDYLRLIRAVRFAARFGFAIEPETAAAVRRFAPRIASVSGERIYDELGKMLTREGGAAALRCMHSLGLARPVLPELFAGSGESEAAGGAGAASGHPPEGHGCEQPSRGTRPGDGAEADAAGADAAAAEAWERSVERVESVSGRGDLTLAVGALLCELDAPAIRAVTRRWGASNEVRDAVTFFSAHREEWRIAPDMPLCDLKRRLGSEHFGRLRRIWRFEERRERGSAPNDRRLARRIRAIDPEQIAPPPFVTGDDLIALGMRPGPELGRLHRALYDAQLNEELGSREAALAAAASLAQGEQEA